MIGHDHSFAVESYAGASRFGTGSRLRKRLLFSLIPLVILGFSTAAAENSLWSPPSLPEPTDEVTDGRTIVQRAVGFIEGHAELAFEALVTYEAVQENGEIVMKTGMPDEDHIKLQITDNGSGIAPVDLPKVFEPFFSAKEKVSGIGLGLAIVHGIVQSHKGKVEIKSELGIGTTVSIILPLVKNLDL